jgi:type 2 lantibiotic biosynthesis protein LanM
MFDDRSPLFRALRLDERLAVDGMPSPPEQAVADAALAPWREQTPFQEPEWLTRRCSLSGIAPPTLAALVEEPPARLADRAGSLPWVDRIEAAYECSAQPPNVERTAFTSIVAPLLGRTWEAFQEQLSRLREKHPEAPFDSDVGLLFYRGLPRRIDNMLSRSVVLEMRIAKLSGELVGDTPEERYQGFVASLSATEGAAQLFTRYPVLVPRILATLDFWREASLELLTRLAEDWPAVVEHFGTDPAPDRLTAISLDLGDLHQEGRTVRCLTFESGFRLVYKPRSMKIDVRFGELLAWLGEHGSIDLRSARVLDRETHGWSELVEPAPCRSDAEAERFYRRQGAFLALFHVLNANDMHSSNLFACGEHPVVVDLESLFGGDYGQLNPSNHDIASDYELATSVGRVMLLPFLSESKDGEIRDISGLGGGGSATGSSTQEVWVNRGTDEMRLARRRVREDEERRNRPTLSEKRIDPRDFAEALEGGFTDTYRVLLRHRDELLKEDSPIRRMGECHVRLILRVTRFYTKFLRDSLHPEQLEDALACDRLFDRLWFGIDRTRFVDVALRVIPPERDAMWRGDIPYFHCRADSRDVHTDGGEVLEGLLQRSGMEIVLEQLHRLSEEDLALQKWVIHGSMAALTVSDDETEYRRYPEPTPRPVSADGLLERAVAVGDRLLETGRIEDDQASWLGLRTAGDGRCDVRVLSTEFFDGLPGVAFFLAYLGEVSGEDRFTSVARKAWNAVRGRIVRIRPDRLGGFDGWGGLIQAAHHLGRLWRDEEILDEARSWLAEIGPLVDEDAHIDMVRGAAGCIQPLLAFAEEDPAALPLARRLGNHLVATAQPGEAGGLCWEVAASYRHPLVGVSHGSSGPAWALAALYGATGEETYRQTAAGALEFEESHFSPRHRNWPDRRIFNPADRREPTYNGTWCHGSCGIGLSRLHMMPFLPEAWRERCAETLEIAFDTTLRQGIGLNHSLCHGDLGALEFLSQAAERLGGEERLRAVRDAVEKVVASIDENGWIHGNPKNVETPGLMTGLAGIGHGLLRLAAPQRVPSVLDQAPPPGA